MPAERWTGYERFCPFAKALDVIGERWTLVIIHALLGGSLRYSELDRRLPGVSTNVLSNRLRKLEAAGVVMRSIGEPSDGVRYGLTERGWELAPAMAEIRRWGVTELIGLNSDEGASYDLGYAIPDNLDLDESYEWEIDGKFITLAIVGQTLTVTPGPATNPALVVHTSQQFLRQWAAGDRNWEQGRVAGDVTIDGPEPAWERMLTATNYHGRPADLLGVNRVDGRGVPYGCGV